ncbi:UNVERIFIED_CONTAM: hypothetical protein Sangu_2245100 [Sesamum angustifolium]|uniref:Uncharacterized protein n=1 Tax=Sesamum angustifolium TaxID=2727405 RepID=A0AAW2L606_9LAMI
MNEEEDPQSPVGPIQKHDPVDVDPLQAVHARHPRKPPPRMIYPAWKTRVREVPSAAQTSIRRRTPNA